MLITPSLDERLQAHSQGLRLPEEEVNRPHQAANVNHRADEGRAQNVRSGGELGVCGKRLP
jgi:hypothetical protein